MHIIKMIAILFGIPVGGFFYRDRKGVYRAHPERDVYYFSDGVYVWTACGYRGSCLIDERGEMLIASVVGGAPSFNAFVKAVRADILQRINRSWAAS